MSDSNKKNIVVIGASAGGISAISRLICGFTEAFNVSIFIVIHVPSDARTSIILNQIQKFTSLPCLLPSDGDEIKNNTIYLAPADYQMMLEENQILIKKGPYENHWRPSIDVLFRTAAASYDSCVTGIILTGLLDDGTSGMSAVKRSGGKIIVQDPNQADFSDMPNNVLQNMEVDFTATLEEIPSIISNIYASFECGLERTPDDVKLESDITIRMSSNYEDLQKLGTPTPFTCPDCGGLLMKMIAEGRPKYRCYTGHAFSELSLEKEQIKGLEDSLWVAIRMMEERKNLLNNMEGYGRSSKRERANEMEKHVERLKEMLLNMNNGFENDDSVN